MTITVTTCQAAIAEFFVQQVVDYLAARLEMPVQFVNDIPWQERQRRLDAGQIDIGWICGAPYVRRIDQQLADIELLAAPVMAAARYDHQPVYFSDIVVRHDSAYRRFADLRGSRWAINERQSYSGYEVVRHYLATQHLDGRFFGRVIESGAHQHSVEMILAGEVDASAVDSTVLELLYARQPVLCQQLRVIQVLGPSPIPPWVIGRHVAPELREAIRSVLLSMHTDPRGQNLLQAGQTACFIAVNNQSYHPTRERLGLAESVSL